PSSRFASLPDGLSPFNAGVAAHGGGDACGRRQSVGGPTSPWNCPPPLSRLPPHPFCSPTVFSHHVQLNPQLELLSHASREAILNSLHTNDSLIFTLRRSKTDQLGISFPIHIFRLNSYLSPYEPLTKYLSARYAANATPQHPLFLTETGKMATRFWFQKHFHNVLLISRIRSEHYSSHSFRIGAASTAARLGTSDQTIQVLGHWSSLAYHAYIRNNLNDLRRAHAQLGSI
ncbi:hypothetical protein KUCAC02_023109, partial [Chaenocephalus aceratus]